MKNKRLIAIAAILAVVAILTVCLVACNADTYRGKLEKADYKVSEVSADDVEYLDDDANISWIVTGVKELNSVWVVKFKKIADAKSFEADMKKLPFMTVERTSSYVFFGSKDGVDVVK